MARVIFDIVPKVKEFIGIEYIALCSDRSAIDFYRKEALGFDFINSIHQIPRNGANDDCEAMYLRLSEPKMASENDVDDDT